MISGWDALIRTWHRVMPTRCRAPWLFRHHVANDVLADTMSREAALRARYSSAVVVAVVGVSHHDAPLHVLDSMTRAIDGLAPRLVGRRDGAVQGAVALTTCNRVELYLDVLHAGDGIADAIEQMTGELPHEMRDAVRVRIDAAAARHLFSVAAGLESMVVGEDEISGQVRRALIQARAVDTTTPALERLFQSASGAAKLVTSTTGLGAAGRSVVGVALDVVEQDHCRLDGASVLLLGTGAYARVVHASLRQRGAGRISVYSSSGRAARFVEGHGGEVVTQDGLAQGLADADLVVACSGAPHHILDLPLMLGVSQRRQHVLPVVDLALTPDVAPEVRDLTSVRVIDLEDVRVRAPQGHAAAVAAAHRLVNDEVAAFERREASRAADPVVVALRRHVEGMVQEEIERVRRGLAPDVQEHVERSLRRLAGRLLHVPTLRARQLAGDGRVEDYHRAMRLLFDVDESR